MTKRELIQVLEAMPCPDETEVLFTWEGIFNEIYPENVYLSADGVLLMDADNNSYRDEFTSGRRSTGK